MRAKLTGLLSLLLLLTACQYEEGPAFSLASRRARISNVWRISLAQVTDAAGVVTDLTADLSGLRYDFRRDESLVVTRTDSAGTETYTGDWALNVDGDRVDFTAIYTDAGGGIHALNGAWYILRLKEKAWFVETRSATTRGRLELLPAE